MKSYKSYELYKILEIPKGTRLIGCKWFYKKKKGVDGKVESSKRMLVVKGILKKRVSIMKRLFVNSYD